MEHNEHGNYHCGSGGIQHFIHNYGFCDKNRGKMRYTDFDRKTHGFAGHMAEPEDGVEKAVIVQNDSVYRDFLPEVPGEP